MDKIEGCGSNEFPTKKNLKISTFDVKIMSSMDEIALSSSAELPNPLADYEKPGYKMCSYVDKFIKTDAGVIPIIKSKLGKDDLFSTFYVRCGIKRNKYIQMVTI